VAYPSLLTVQWVRCSPSGDVRVDCYVAARAELGACSFGVASPAPGVGRGTGPRESPCSAWSAGPRSGGPGSAEDLQRWNESDTVFPGTVLVRRDPVHPGSGFACSGPAGSPAPVSV
jgi:hypothetical protein